MAYLLALSILGNLAISYTALHYIREHNRAAQIERRNLYDRIQAPEVAVVEAAREEPSAEPLYVDPMDDEAMVEHEKSQRRVIRG